MTKKRTEAFFAAALCAMLSAVLLVMSLLMLLDAAAVYEEVSALESEKRELEMSCRGLEARLAMRLPPEELERRAREELGMVNCRPDQIICLEPVE